MSSDDWCTPAELAELLGPFDLDPCSNDRSHIQARHAYASDAQTRNRRDGLAADWPWVWSVFVNPPYSDVMPWARRLVDHRGPWCALLKLDPTTKWWATLMLADPVIAPFRRRLKFEGEQSMTANFPSVLVYRAWCPSSALREHERYGLWLRSFLPIRGGS